MKKFGIIFLALSIFIGSSSITVNLFCNDKPLVIEQSNKETFMSQYGDYIICSSLIALVGAVFLIIRWEQNRILQEQQNHERNINDNDIIQVEQENLNNYKSLYELDCKRAGIVDIESFMTSIKEKNHFPYFIPYRSKVAYTHSQCIKSLDRINERLNPQFISYNTERNLDGLISLKNEYEEFIQKLVNLKEVAYKCIVLSTTEYLLFNWVLTTARIADNKLESNSFFFRYLVEDLI
jgi:hypothetical protein